MLCTTSGIFLLVSFSFQVPVYVSLFQEMQFYNMHHSMERVLKGNYAFISWKTYFRNLIARDYTDRNGDTKVTQRHSNIHSLTLALLNGQNNGERGEILVDSCITK